jgi:fructose-1,6-bisphosphatase
MDPADLKNPEEPDGKLRLTCKAAPLAFIAEQSGCNLKWEVMKPRSIQL